MPSAADQYVFGRYQVQILIVHVGSIWQALL
jgi:hypothetical protein